jgi:hypothetical protein
MLLTTGKEPIRHLADTINFATASCPLSLPNANSWLLMTKDTLFSPINNNAATVVTLLTDAESLKLIGSRMVNTSDNKKSSILLMINGSSQVILP